MWSRNVLSAPAPMKYLTVSIEPLDAAKCKGVSSHVFGASSAKSAWFGMRATRFGETVSKNLNNELFTMRYCIS